MLYNEQSMMYYAQNVLYNTVTIQYNTIQYNTVTIYRVCCLLHLTIQGGAGATGGNNLQGSLPSRGAWGPLAEGGQ